MRKPLLWIALVYLFSALCYLPMALERLGAASPGGLARLSACFVLVPALVTAAFLIRGRQLGAYLARNFKAVSPREGGLCLLAALAGLSISWCWSLAGQVDLLGRAYPSPAAFAGACLYLTATGLAEELAWRGFLLDRLAAGGRRTGALLLTGVLWAVWHLPMWLIRNALGLPEVLPLLLWAVLVAIVLGRFYCAFHNVLSTALLHMAFNVCFLAPVPLNVLLLLAGLAIYGAVRRERR